MPAKFRRTVVILAAFVLRLGGASAQQPPAGNTKELPQQPAATTSSSKQAVAPIVPDRNDALENPVLDDADEEHITYMHSDLLRPSRKPKEEIGLRQGTTGRSTPKRAQFGFLAFNYSAPHRNHRPIKTPFPRTLSGAVPNVGVNGFGLSPLESHSLPGYELQHPRLIADSVQKWNRLNNGTF